MAKADQKQARQTANQNQQVMTGNVNTQVQGLGGQQKVATDRQGNAFTDASTGIKSAQTTGGYDPTQLGTLRQTAGYDPTIEGSITSGYGGLAENGGFDDAAKGAFMRQATSSIPGIYKVLSAQAQQHRDATGGLGTGGDISQMARQLSQQSSMANTNAEVALNDRVTQNKLAGLGGLQVNQSDIAGKKLGLEGSVASGVTAANSQMKQLFDSTTGEISDTGNKILAYYGLQNASNQTQQQVLTQLANTPGVFDNVLRTVTAVSGAAQGAGSMGLKF